MFRFYIIVFACFFPTLSYSIEPELREKLSSSLKKAIPEAQVENISESPVKGLYQVDAGVEVFYISESGDHLLYGLMFDLNKDKEHWNLTESAKKNNRAKILKNLASKDMVIFPAKAPFIGRVFVFTDIDCYYCQRLHQDMDLINQAGIEVNYLAFPRGGIGSTSYDKMVSIWCADEKLQSMTKAKRGESIPSKNCRNPVKEQFELGEDLGVKGTPALLFQDGSLWPGYVPIDQLKEKVLAHSNN